jgi:hypothetical protein
VNTLSTLHGADRTASPTTVPGHRAYRLPAASAPRSVPRRVPEGTIPLISVEGHAYDCGREYGEIVRARYPGYDRYLRHAAGWANLPAETRRLFERRAPYIPELFRGLADSGSGSGNAPDSPASASASAPASRVPRDGCTAFALSGDVTLDGHPISGQTKDVSISAAALFIVLRLRITGGPTVLVLAYPGEVLGLGLWSTGMTLFRNSLMSTGGASEGLPMEQWGLLALAGSSVHEAIEIAERHGISGAGCHLISDKAGAACSVEYNAGGVGLVWAEDGIATHANHPEAAVTRPHEDLEWAASERENSRYRMHGLHALFAAERGRLTAQRAMQTLGDHTYYPQGICRHWIEGEPDSETVSAAVCEPGKGLLHVVRGQPCSNWATTYAI